jgi:hypothetical protein
MQYRYDPACTEYHDTPMSRHPLQQKPSVHPGAKTFLRLKRIANACGSGQNFSIKGTNRLILMARTSSY